MRLSPSPTVQIRLRAPRLVFWRVISLIFHSYRKPFDHLDCATLDNPMSSLLSVWKLVSLSNKPAAKSTCLRFCCDACSYADSYCAFL